MLTTTNPEQLGFAAERLARIDAHLQHYVDDGKLAGIVTLVARRGQLVHVGCLGYQSLEARQPMQPNSLFRIYSMTKPITSVAAMLLLEEGKLLLQDPVAKYIPSLRKVQVYEGRTADGLQLVKPRRPMTIHDLFLHTAGLSYGLFTDSPVEALYREQKLFEAPTLAAMVERLSTLPLVHHPGTVWRYSVATDVLGHVIELIADIPLADFLQQRIFGPLGMEDTGFWVPQDKLDRFTAVYEPNPAAGIRLADDPEDSPFARPRTLLAGGSGLVSTAPDYFRFAQMVLNKGELDGIRLLGRKSTEYMIRNHLPSTLLPIQLGPDVLSGYGFGLGFSVVLDPSQYGVISSTGNLGWSGMANTTFWIDPQEELIGILLTQFLPSGFYATSKQFKNLVNQALVS